MDFVEKKGKGEHRSDGGRVVGMMSKGMRSGTGGKPLRYGNISPTYQTGVSRGVQAHRGMTEKTQQDTWKERTLQYHKGRYDKGESQTRCSKAQCSMSRKGCEGGEAITR